MKNLTAPRLQSLVGLVTIEALNEGPLREKGIKRRTQIVDLKISGEAEMAGLRKRKRHHSRLGEITEGARSVR